MLEQEQTATHCIDARERSEAVAAEHSIYRSRYALPVLHAFGNVRLGMYHAHHLLGIHGRSEIQDGEMDGDVLASYGDVLISKLRLIQEFG